MKILVLSSSYPRYAADTSGHFVKELNEILEDEGHRVRTLAWRGERTSDNEKVRFVSYAPPRFETLFFKSGAPENLGKPINQILIAPAMLAMWRAIVKEEQPDLVIGHWAMPGGILARLAGDFFDVPSIVVGHSGGLHRLRKMGEHSIIRSLVLDGPMTIPSSAFQSLAPNAKLLPIGFHPIDRTIKRVETQDALIMSRLEPIKNVQRVIRAWDSKTATLHIAGEGSCRTFLEKLAKGLGKNVVFHGNISGVKKSHLMSSVKYFFLPSQVLDGRHEGFPIGLLQAIDFGLIPLVANFPGASDVLTQTFLVDEDEDWSKRFKSLSFEKKELQAMRESVFERRWSQIGRGWVDWMSL